MLREHILPLHRDGHQNGRQSGYIFHCCFVDCHPGGCWGNTEQVDAQWWHPVTSGEALVMLNWAMRSILLQCIRFAIKIAQDEGAFIHRRCLF
jgi:hypothetical protein